MQKATFFCEYEQDGRLGMEEYRANCSDEEANDKNKVAGLVTLIIFFFKKKHGFEPTKVIGPLFEKEKPGFIERLKRVFK